MGGGGGGGGEATLINISISNGDLTCQRMIPAAPNQVDKVRSSVGILALPFRPLYNNMSLRSLLRFLKDSHFKCSTMLVILQFHNCSSLLQSSGSISNFIELVLKAYTRRVPNRTAVLQVWAQQSFVCCVFYLLWTSV